MISSIKNFISKFHTSLTKVSRVQTPDKNPLTDSIFLNWFWLNSSMKYQNSGKSEPKTIFEFVESFFFWWIKVSQKGTIKQNLNFRAYSSNFIFMINVTIKEEKKQFQQKAKISKMGKFSIFLGKNQQNEKSIKTAQRPSTRFNNWYLKKGNFHNCPKKWK